MPLEVPAAAPPLEWFDLEQGSDHWHQVRCGVITASRFSDVLAQGKGLTRGKYMRELAGEIITGVPAETFSNSAMDRGKEMEAEARAEYEFWSDAVVRMVGFARRGRVGCSPDGMTDKGPIEIKTKLPHLLIECIERGDMPPEHRAQVQGAMWVTETDTADLIAYWPKMPPFIKTVHRDDEFIANLASEIDRFTDELDAMVERVRSYRFAA
jgi:hypothetical protein